eukprot:CAMPEP_0179227266 /NCGR_PEP_ID=MMETSP0797-20121207/9232_1 /TAXON_ID=47934 /ORGANISM="Dinophysis acuminata, Strain DAEP01" /LENGTH=127 /DNA_ID=CAMNT_0020934303 /DNA_START=99 /DNA_END=480 /DNA_ORIENTATION=+
MSWVGTGRLLFSLEWKKEDYERLLERMLVACAEMKKGGWWEPPVANIKKKLAIEMGTAAVKNMFSFDDRGAARRGDVRGFAAAFICRICKRRGSFAPTDSRAFPRGLCTACCSSSSSSSSGGKRRLK